MKDLNAIKTENAQFVIFSTQPNDSTTVMSFMMENNIPFKVVLGSYKNEKETSYIVPATNFDAIVDAGLVRDQESVLVLGAYIGQGRKATIVYLDDREPEELGAFVNTTRELALAQEAWSFDPMSDQFFVIEEAA